MDRPHYLALLADACSQGGRIAEGLDAVSEGLAIVQKSRGGQPFFYEAELHRLKGLLLLRRAGFQAEAKASLLRALEVARRQESRSLELRAALDLARLGHAADARDQLQEVYAWFTEGSETPDLIDAQGLLDAPT